MTNYFTVSPISELSSLEVHQLYKLRVDTFVAQQKTPYAEIDDADASSRTAHVLYWERKDDGSTTLIGCARLLPSTVGDTAASIGATIELDDATEVSVLGRLIVDERYRGGSIGKDIMNNTLRLAFERAPERDVVLASQTPLKEFYEEFGFTACGPEFDDHGTPHIPMVLRAEELERFAK